MTAQLAPADWREDPRLQAIVDALGQTRFVGGVVRDALLGARNDDIDLGTPRVPAEVMVRLTHAGMAAIPTGLAHGTITAVCDGLSVEVTTLRRDVSTDGRRATVAFTTDWKEDAARRDFTINALSAEPDSGVVHDYFDGLRDLAAQRVRFVGDADQRIAEDHLRILRYFRFLARFPDGELDEAALQACERGAPRLMALSRERVRDELLRLLSATDPLRSVRLMQKRGVLATVLPEVLPEAAERLAALLVREGAQGTRPDPLRRLLALLPRDAELVDKVAARLRFSNAQRAALASPIAVALDAPARAEAYRHSREALLDAAMLWADDQAVQRMQEAVAAFTPPSFPLTGRHLIARGIEPGPLVAGLLRTVEDRWIAEGFPGRARLDAIADQAVAETKKA